MEGVAHCPEDAIMPRDMFLLQVSLDTCIFCLNLRNNDDGSTNLLVESAFMLKGFPFEQLKLTFRKFLLFTFLFICIYLGTGIVYTVY